MFSCPVGQLKGRLALGPPHIEGSGKAKHPSWAGNPSLPPNKQGAGCSRLPSPQPRWTLRATRQCATAAQGRHCLPRAQTESSCATWLSPPALAARDGRRQEAAFCKCCARGSQPSHVLLRPLLRSSAAQALPSLGGRFARVLPVSP